jgi:hypothetical protein
LIFARKLQLRPPGGVYFPGNFPLPTRRACPYPRLPLMRSFAAACIVFVGGFAIMVLEIIGTRFLAPHFGTSYYVWVNQIGLVMVALALGYYFGGILADRWRRLGKLAWLL